MKSIIAAAGVLAGTLSVSLASMSGATTTPGVAVAGPTVVKAVLTLAGARAVMDRAMEECERVGAGPSIAVVDDGGHLVCFARSDGSFAAGAEVSIGKARTAAIFKKPTRAFEDSINSGR